MAHKKPDTLVIVLHEIYGINQHIRDICTFFAEQHVAVMCPNLLNRDDPFDYAQHQMAYHNFTRHVGFKHASQKVDGLIAKIHDQYAKIFVIGFSVGATVAWLCSQNEHVDGLVCYYGSRIRDYVDQSPKCPALLFFPKKEKSFDVRKLVATLSNQHHLHLHICNGEHGFCDPFSKAYNEQVAHETLKETMSFLKGIRSSS